MRAELNAAAARMGQTRAALTIEEAVRQVRQQYKDRAEEVRQEGTAFCERLKKETQQVMKERVEQYTAALETSVKDRKEKLERSKEQVLHRTPLRKIKREVRSMWGLKQDGSSTLASTFSGRRPTGADLARRLAANKGKSAESTASPASEKRAGRYLRMFLASSLRHAGYSGKLFETLRAAAVHFPLSLRLRLSVFKGEASKRGSEVQSRESTGEAVNGRHGGSGPLLREGERSVDIDDILAAAMRNAKQQNSGVPPQPPAVRSPGAAADGGKGSGTPPAAHPRGSGASDQSRQSTPGSARASTAGQSPAPAMKPLTATLLGAPTPRTRAAEGIERELEQAKLRHAGMRAALAAAATAQEEAGAIEAYERRQQQEHLRLSRRHWSHPQDVRHRALPTGGRAPPSPETTVLRSPDLDPISPSTGTIEALIRDRSIKGGAADELRHAVSRMSGDAADSMPDGIAADEPSDALQEALQRETSAISPRDSGETMRGGDGSKQTSRSSSSRGRGDSRDSTGTGMEAPVEAVSRGNSSRLLDTDEGGNGGRLANELETGDQVEDDVHDAEHAGSSTTAGV